MLKIWPFFTSQWGTNSPTRSPETGVHLHTDTNRHAKFDEILHISFSVIVPTRTVYGWTAQRTPNLIAPVEASRKVFWEVIFIKVEIPTPCGWKLTSYNKCSIVDTDSLYVWYKIWPFLTSQWGMTSRTRFTRKSLRTPTTDKLPWHKLVSQSD